MISPVRNPPKADGKEERCAAWVQTSITLPIAYTPWQSFLELVCTRLSVPVLVVVTDLF